MARTIRHPSPVPTTSTRRWIVDPTTSKWSWSSRRPEDQPTRRSRRQECAYRSLRCRADLLEPSFGGHGPHIVRSSWRQPSLLPSRSYGHGAAFHDVTTTIAPGTSTMTRASSDSSTPFAASSRTSSMPSGASVAARNRVSPTGRGNGNPYATDSTVLGRPALDHEASGGGRARIRRTVRAESTRRRNRASATLRRCSTSGGTPRMSTLRPRHGELLAQTESTSTTFKPPTPQLPVPMIAASSPSTRRTCSRCSRRSPIRCSPGKRWCNSPHPLRPRLLLRNSIFVSSGTTHRPLTKLTSRERRRSSTTRFVRWRHMSCSR